MDKALHKLNILADAAKYDVSCSSSGSSRASDGGLGNAKTAGVCHSFTEDGRCISLLKILYTNHCIYDCAYCINRRSNDIKRATFEAKELADLCINFYRRNYIEGLFLSSGVINNPDYTMERLIAVVRMLRQDNRFNGYVHLKAIPGADPELIRQAGLLADRLSVNIEIPSEQQLLLLAPEKDFKSVFNPMNLIKDGIVTSKEERKKHRKAPQFVPAGQSTQLIVGASPETDFTILKLASGFYNEQKLKRVYYSGFLPVNGYDKRLPAISKPPLVRENRLYQADWLMRFYQFDYDEILDEQHPELDLNMDPKLAYALRHPELFPIDPDYDIVKLLAPHFKSRFADQEWVIYDVRRKYGIWYDKIRVQKVAFHKPAFDLSSGYIREHVRDHDEDYYRTLWQHYYDAINIIERQNHKQMKAFMPKRYWKYLPEKQHREK